MFLGEPIPLPELDHPDATQPKIESYFVDRAVNHKRGPSRPSPHNYKYRLRLRRYGPKTDLEYRADEIPMSRIDRRIPSPKGFATRDNLTFFAPPPFSRETEAYSRRGRARTEAAQIDPQMLRGVTE